MYFILRINITEADESMNDTAIEETTMIPAENYNKLVNIMEEMVEKLKVYLFNVSTFFDKIKIVVVGKLVLFIIKTTKAFN